MLTAIPTQRGTGISIWGDDEDLRALYKLVHTLAGDTEYTKDAKGGRVQILHYVAYEIRHAYQDLKTSFIYPLNEQTRQLAYIALEEVQKGIAYTLINVPAINSLMIDEELIGETVYQIEAYDKIIVGENEAVITI